MKWKYDQWLTSTVDLVPLSSSQRWVGICMRTNPSLGLTLPLVLCLWFWPHNSFWVWCVNPGFKFNSLLGVDVSTSFPFNLSEFDNALVYKSWQKWLPVSWAKALIIDCNLCCLCIGTLALGEVQLLWDCHAVRKLKVLLWRGSYGRGSPSRLSKVTDIRVKSFK